MSENLIKALMLLEYAFQNEDKLFELYDVYDLAEAAHSYIQAEVMQSTEVSKKAFEIVSTIEFHSQIVEQSERYLQ